MSLAEVIKEIADRVEEDSRKDLGQSVASYLQGIVRELRIALKASEGVLEASVHRLGVSPAGNVIPPTIPIDQFRERELHARQKRAIREVEDVIMMQQEDREDIMLRFQDGNSNGDYISVPANMKDGESMVHSGEVYVRQGMKLLYSEEKTQQARNRVHV